MTIPGTQCFPAPDLPLGFVVPSYDQIRRMDLLIEAINQSYHGLWGVGIVGFNSIIHFSGPQVVPVLHGFYRVLRANGVRLLCWHAGQEVGRAGLAGGSLL